MRTEVRSCRSVGWLRDLFAFSLGGVCAYQPLNEAELGAFEQLDREALGLHVLERFAKDMLGPEAKQRRREQPLDAPDRSGWTAYVFEYHEAPAGRSTRLTSATAARSSGIVHNDSVHTTRSGSLTFRS